MKYIHQLTTPARLVLLDVLCLVTILSVSKLTKVTGTIGKEDLSGTWVATLTGDEIPDPLGACRKEVRTEVQGIGFIGRDGEFAGVTVW